jgi:hypothetical protein
VECVGKMILKSIALAMLLMLGPQWTLGSRGFNPPASSVVNPPAMTYRWAAYNTLNTCGTTGSTACTTTGQVVYSMPSLATSNTATDPNGIVIPPTYLLNAVNAQPAVTFYSTTDNTTYLQLTDAFNPTSIVVYAVVNFPSLTFPSTNGGIIGGQAGGSFEWRIDPGGAQEILSAEVYSIATSTATYAPGTTYTLVASYNTATGAYFFGHCSSGTLVNDGSGNGEVLTFSQDIETLGSVPASGDYYYGWIAEAGIGVNTNSTTDICAWSKSQYGI